MIWLVLALVAVAVPICWIMFGNWVYQKAYRRYDGIEGDWYYLSRLNALEMSALAQYPLAHSRAIAAKARREQSYNSVDDLGV